MIFVAETDPRDPQAAALLRQSHALMQALFPPEDNAYLEIEALLADHIHFYTARIDDRIVGTAAIALKGDYAEVKSMFVAEEARGKGVADALLRQLEDTARAAQIPWLKLETGNVLYAAHKVYERHGFTFCGMFGDYTRVGSSLFMEKALT